MELSSFEVEVMQRHVQHAVLGQRSLWGLFGLCKCQRSNIPNSPFLTQLELRSKVRDLTPAGIFHLRLPPAVAASVKAATYRNSFVFLMIFITL